MKAPNPATTPLKIQRKPEAHTLRVEWADEHVCEMHYEYLRRACPCAICNKERDEATSGLRVVTEEAALGPLQIDEITPVGSYAVRLTWSDGHNTGFYSFRFLRELCPHEGGGLEAIRFESFRDIRDILRQEGQDGEVSEEKNDERTPRS
ncbi:MAG: DUF971 domain-containing protein [bacterium]|nr:DUF971 domain-containing protein [bacterium]